MAELPSASTESLTIPLELFSAAPAYDDDSASSIASLEFTAGLPDIFDNAGAKAKLATRLEERRLARESTMGFPVSHPRPLKLLDLPVEILKMIIREVRSTARPCPRRVQLSRLQVPHTNDVTALARVNSALHKLCIPQIYGRFDIVWPETAGAADLRTNVDALTYGLSTLVTSRPVFEPRRTARVPHSPPPPRRLGNDYAQHVRAFALGNGPSELVSDYLIGKEAGKMLCTLVALALARMTNLERFSWDMPTGVFREVWESLAWGGPAERLQSVWFRCPSAEESASITVHGAHHTQGHAAAHGTAASGAHHAPPSAPQGPAPPQFVPPSAHTLPSALPSESSERTALRRSYRQIEAPNVSILPPLKRLAVLTMDQVAYLEEVAIVIGKSVDCLRELRLSIDLVESPKEWFPSEQKDPASSHGLAGGVLGYVFKEFYDCRRRTRHADGADVKEEAAKAALANRLATIAKQKAKLAAETAEEAVATCKKDASALSSIHSRAGSSVASLANSSLGSDESLRSVEAQKSQKDSCLSGHADAGGIVSTEPIHTKKSSPSTTPISTTDGTPPASEGASPSVSSKPSLHVLTNTRKSPPASISRQESTPNLLSTFKRPSRRKLQLSTLELGRIPLHTTVLLRSLDWTKLTTLTLLDCAHDDELWTALRRLHAPSASYAPTPSTPAAPRRLGSDTLQYSLQLRRIRTNGVSPALLAVLNETLAPNSLEWLFLQDRSGGPATTSASVVPEGSVSIEQIYRGPLRRHRASLRKVMIDSVLDGQGTRGRDGQRWRRWQLPREGIQFVTSGKMSALRELAVALAHEDWVSLSPAGYSVRPEPA